MLSDTLNEAVEWTRTNLENPHWDPHRRCLMALEVILEYSRRWLDVPHQPVAGLVDADFLRRVADALDNKELPFPSFPNPVPRQQ